MKTNPISGIEWAIKPEKRELVANTISVDLTALPVLIGFDAMRICMGAEPENFTRAGVTRWMRVMSP